MDIDDAVSLPRFHHQWLPDRILHDAFAISPDTRVKLNEMGHANIVQSSREIGEANSIQYVDGVMRGIKDPRGEGAAIGF